MTPERPLTPPLANPSLSPHVPSPPFVAGCVPMLRRWRLVALKSNSVVDDRTTMPTPVEHFHDLVLH